MELRRRWILGGAALALLGGVVAGCDALGSNSDDVPIFEVDPLWPMPLEYPYIWGAVTGVAVAPDDHVLMVTRNDVWMVTQETGATLSRPGAYGLCCIPSDPVLEYDAQGNLVRSWGGPGDGYTWFQRPHGIAVDPQGNVWIGGSGAPGGGGGGRGGGAGGGGGQAAPQDTHILKFSREGAFLAQYGQPGTPASSQSTTSFGGPARIAFDPGANEAYVADGFINRRVVVLDMETGEVKRFWGAYGNPPEDGDIGPYDPNAPPAQQFRTVTCARPSNDGLVYVCDRGNNRIQVFRTDGTFVAEQVIAPQTRGRGSVWDIAFSPDSRQRFLYVADGMNERAYIVERESLEVLTSFGTGGRYPSHFRALGSIAVDSRGNVYTGEDEEGKRLQKFVNTGTGPVTAEHQGAVWPSWN